MVEVGTRLRLSQRVGEVSALEIGMVGTVDEIVPAEVEGAGTHDEDHAVLNFEVAGLTRRVSFTDHQLDEWFVSAEEAE